MRIIVWIDKANDKTEFLDLKEDYEEKEKDGEGGVTYLYDGSDSEIEPLYSEDDESDKSSDDAKENGDKEDVLTSTTDGKQHGHLVGNRIPWRKYSKTSFFF